MNLDTVELINEIMIRPEIWMSKHPAYKNKWKIVRKWEELRNSKFPEYSVDDLKKRWKNIKDQYRKELKKLPQSRPGVPMENVTSGWKYFEFMTFLKDELNINQSAEPEIIEEQDQLIDSNPHTSEYRMMEITQVKAETLPSTHSREPSLSKSDDDVEPPTVLMNPRKCNQAPKEMREELLKIEQRKLAILEAELEKSNAFTKSDNYQFLMSILPEMERLPPVHKMRLRMKISQAVLDELTSFEQDKVHHIELINMQPSNSIDVKEEPINMYD